MKINLNSITLAIWIAIFLMIVFSQDQFTTFEFIALLLISFLGICIESNKKGSSE